MLINCRRYVSLVTDAREGSLSVWDRSRFRLHRTICPYCRRYESSLDTTLALVRDQPPEPPTDAMRAELLAKLRATFPRRS